MSHAASSKILKYKLYGVPLSQPFRSVAWTMLQLQQKIQIEIAVPGATNKMGTKHANFRSLTPYQNTTIPLLAIEEENGNVHHLSESPAIMMYLCESSNSSNSLYPSTTSTTTSPLYYSHHPNTEY